MKDTFYAPASRATYEKIESDFNELSRTKYVLTIITGLPEIIVILNKERQIVFANEALVKFLGIVDAKEVLGFRLGEAIKCVNSTLTKGGCGTSDACRYCGALKAILESQRILQKVTNESRITSHTNGKKSFLDLRVTSAPFIFQNECYSIFTIDDISDIKKRKMLEHIFFHDIANMAGEIRGITDILIRYSQNHQIKEYVSLINMMSKELLEETMFQQSLIFAENGDLQPFISNFSTGHILKEAVSYLSHHAISCSKTIFIDGDASILTISSDKVLLKHVLINMLRNALESSPDDAEIILNCKEDGDFIIFTVHNNDFIASEKDEKIRYKPSQSNWKIGFMPHNMQARIFQRSFSSIGKDYGLETYLINRLTENYLKGTAGITSSSKNGKDFFVRIPL